ncbi:MAG TPA: CHRD domain-containing protein [Caulobacteraceae bacterium]|jgi:hypothetical protein
MRIQQAVLGAILALAASASATPLRAEILSFDAALDGKYGSAPTGSKATGAAKIKVDTERQRVSVDLTVEGITTEALWDKLVAAPIGPIHLHKYATPAGGASVLVVPLPYGADYHATARGMHVTATDMDYAAGARLVNSTLSFEDFVSALREGLIVLNIHTDAHNPGEISGLVTVPGAAGRYPKAAPKADGGGHDHSGHGAPGPK